MGHLDHGSSLAFPSHADRYGFLTINGSTGGVKREALTQEARKSAVAAAMKDRVMALIGIKSREKNSNNRKLHTTVRGGEGLVQVFKIAMQHKPRISRAVACV
jgi:hypothetical protein